VRLESVSAEALARAVAEELAGEAEKRGARVEVGTAPQVTADAGRLTAILRQLFLNALQFLAPSRAGTVHFGGHLQDREAWLWVRDNGIGLRAEDGERVFQPFGRVREVEAPGAGTGLATVRKLLRQQGGRIWVESTHGEGSTFYLALPRAD
jgi:signal transduction histidine kinase